MYIRLLGGTVYYTKEIEFTTKRRIIFTSLPEKWLVNEPTTDPTRFNTMIKMDVDVVDSITQGRPRG